MDGLVLSYLNKNYRVSDSSITEVNGGRIYGLKLVNQLSTIFTINESVCFNIIKSWFLFYDNCESHFTIAYGTKIVRFPIEFGLEPVLVESMDDIRDRDFGIVSYRDITISLVDSPDMLIRRKILDFINSPNMGICFDMQIEECGQIYFLNGCYISQIDCYRESDFETNQPNCDITVSFNSYMTNFNQYTTN